MAMAGAHLNQDMESQLPLLIHEQEAENQKIITDEGEYVAGDSWYQVLFVLVTGLNTASVLAYSGSVMVNLGWIVGVVGFITAISLSFDANALLARLHEYGGKRHLRYRDLAGHIYGKKGYFAIWALQYIELFMVSIGFVILGGSALKAVFELFGDGMKLSYCNLIAGFLCFVLAILIPHLSALRVWLGLSTVLTVIYVTVAIVLSIKDGAKASARDYSVSGTLASRIFKAIGSFAIMAMCSNTGMLPEIQATIRKPVVGNMMKALYLQFTVGLLPMLGVVLVGYWAYGSSTSTYLLDSTTGPTWVKALANISAFFQAVISFHIYASPTYEYFDTTYGIKGSAMTIRNLSFRTGLRGSYVLMSSLLAALLPFFGDIMTLNGALCLIPLTFVIPHHMYLVAKKNKLPSSQKLWHWLNVSIFGLFSIIAAIAGVRLIIVDSKNYKFFD